MLTENVLDPVGRGQYEGVMTLQWALSFASGVQPGGCRACHLKPCATLPMQCTRAGTIRSHGKPLSMSTV